MPIYDYKCENCGNEAEMIITCTLEESESEKPAEEARVTTASEEASAKSDNKVKGSAKCTHCGGEADIWVDFNR